MALHIRRCLAYGLLPIVCLGLLGYAQPHSFYHPSETKEVEQFFKKRYPISPIGIDVNNWFSCGMMLPPAIIIRDGCEDIKYHELIHLRHFYDDPSQFLNFSKEESKTQKETEMFKNKQ